ncbi:twin-arginine translocase TatA/TatE family subunit [Lyticum sinuosum]|uniref:Sec-independent protein translocase protein TatA n=1 Tax=Lyticum sinuosum TaxID=1332059 RepID=A0AAE4VLG9_9RICK|nr:twin-arginine translocase TatA/TatE family subunit [Lyticum sinuosum]MDZ5761437.1 Sec-independent protein translocase protein TatA [Lyticum sinuosum]
MNGRVGEMLVILLVVLILFGAGKLPQVMRDLGKGVRAFREGMNDQSNNNNNDTNNKD